MSLINFPFRWCFHKIKDFQLSTAHPRCGSGACCRQAKLWSIQPSVLLRPRYLLCAQRGLFCTTIVPCPRVLLRPSRLLLCPSRLLLRPRRLPCRPCSLRQACRELLSASALFGCCRSRLLCSCLLRIRSPRRIPRLRIRPRIQWTPRLLLQEEVNFLEIPLLTMYQFCFNFQRICTWLYFIFFVKVLFRYNCNKIIAPKLFLL